MLEPEGGVLGLVSSKVLAHMWSEGFYLQWPWKSVIETWRI